VVDLFSNRGRELLVRLIDGVSLEIVFAEREI
jgi:hypothetical protein